MKQYAVAISRSSYRAVNEDGRMATSLSESGELTAQIRYDSRAHLSIEVFEPELRLDSYHDIFVSFQVFTEQSLTLWLAFVDNHNGWHNPIERELAGSGWHDVRVRLQDFVEHHARFGLVKLIFRQDCMIKLRALKVEGLAKPLSGLNVVVPWHSRISKRLAARDRALSMLDRQTRSFSLCVVELVTDGGPPTFAPTSPHHEHLVLNKERSYEGIFHKESLLNYYIDTRAIQRDHAYLFLDGDVFAEDDRWLQSAMDKLSDLCAEHEDILMQPYASVVDDTTGQRAYSFACVHKTTKPTLSVNSGLCWLIAGDTLIEASVRFPHRLVTGIADAGFVNKYIGNHPQLPYLPAFARHDVANTLQLEVDYLDSELTHCNHGDTTPHNYALRDHLWQACVDFAAERAQPALIEDDDGFMHFPFAEHPAQFCLQKMFRVQSLESVQAEVLRAHGSPAASLQHLSLEESVSLKTDPRTLSHQQRVQWEVQRANQRLYNLGVDHTSVSPQQFQMEPGVSATKPRLLDAVKTHATHSILLLTADGAIVFPHAVAEIEQCLKTADVVFVDGEHTQIGSNEPAWGRLLIEPPPAKCDQVVAIACRRSWWEANQVKLPQGLIWSANHIDCLADALGTAAGEIPRVRGFARLVDAMDSDSAVVEHNSRITQRIRGLIAAGFIRLDSVDASRRKIRIAPKYSWQHHYSGHDLINVLSRLEIEDGTLFNPAIDPTFTYLERGATAYEEPWTGILHGVFDYPEHLPNPDQSLGHVLRQSNFQQSLDYCRGVFTYTDYLRQRVLASKHWPGLPICVLPHTTSPPRFGFRAGRYLAEANRQVLAIGFYAKRISSFFELNAGDHEKVLLAPMSKPVYHDYLRREIAEAASGEDSVTFAPRVSNETYDELLSRSPVFLDYYDLSASNTLTECIVRNVPMVLRRHPAAEETLGADYPLFFDSIDEASALLHEPEALLAGHQYLAQIGNARFFHPAFLAALETSRIYQCL